MKKIIGGLLVLAVVLGILTVGMLFRKEEDKRMVTAPIEPVAQDERIEEMVPLTGTDTLQSLLALGQNLECLIMYKSQNGGVSEITEGTYFTSQGKMRGDFVIPEMIEGSVSSMILTDGVIYSWTEIEGEKYGMKITLEDLAESKITTGAPEVNEAVPLDAAVSYTCKPWVAFDGSVFEVPTDVLFKEYKDLIRVGMEYSTSYEESDATVAKCAVCEQLPDTEKTQCRDFLSCE